jgi:hypothetical protein
MMPAKPMKANNNGREFDMINGKRY